MRAHLRSLLCSAALVTAIWSAQAQLPGSNPTPARLEEAMKAQANSANIQAWLKSKDPRLIAWGAHFARENNDTDALALAAQLVKESLTQGGPDLLSPDDPHVNALSEVLDALIQRRVLLSAELLGYVSRSHPVQTIILLSMLPSAEQTENLMQWFGGARSADGSNQLDRVSAMLLSQSSASRLRRQHPRELGGEAHYLHPFPRKNMGVGLGSGSGGVACGSYGINRPPVGWPELFSYQLNENDTTGTDPFARRGGR